MNVHKNENPQECPLGAVRPRDIDLLSGHGDGHGRQHPPYTSSGDATAQRACSRAFVAARQRVTELTNGLHHSNWLGPHAGIKANPPIGRSGLDMNNVMRLHK